MELDLENVVIGWALKILIKLHRIDATNLEAVYTMDQKD